MGFLAKISAGGTPSFVQIRAMSARRPERPDFAPLPCDTPPPIDLQHKFPELDPQRFPGLGMSPWCRCGLLASAAKAAGSTSANNTAGLRDAEATTAGLRHIASPNQRKSGLRTRSLPMRRKSGRWGTKRATGHSQDSQQRWLQRHDDDNAAKDSDASNKSKVDT